MIETATDGPIDRSVMVRGQSLSRVFGTHTALRDLDIEVPAGSIVGLIGPSGGGKTTAVRLLCGLDRPTSGSVQLFDRALSNLGRNRRRRMALLSQDPALVEEYTIGEHVAWHARLRHVELDRVPEVLDSVGLLDSSGTRISDASGGMRRRTGLAAALVGDPDLLFCDEPTAGLDPIIRDQIWTEFRRRRHEGRSMLVTTQHIDEAARCDRVVVLSEGEVVADCVPSELAETAGLDEQIVLSVVPPHGVAAFRILRRNHGPAVSRIGDNIVLNVQDAADQAGPVAAILADADIDLERLEVVVPQLDEVFRAIVEQR